MIYQPGCTSHGSLYVQCRTLDYTGCRCVEHWAFCEGSVGSLLFFGSLDRFWVWLSFTPCEMFFSLGSCFMGQDHGGGLYSLLVCSEGFSSSGSSRVIPRFQPWSGHSRIVGIILFAILIQKIVLHV